MSFRNWIMVLCVLLSLSEGLAGNSKGRIGILTSGGDCSGLNSIIYGAYKRASDLGYELIGFQDGVYGLVNGNYMTLDGNKCSTDMLSESGSILGSYTKPLKDKDGKPLSNEEGDERIIEQYHKLNLKGLIYIGGDGSVGIMKNILKRDKDLNIIAVPKTIDNDIAHTDVAVGFSTVTKVVSKAIANIISTAKSHSRVMVVEVMGRSAGYIALTSGLAVGADIIIIPELKCDMQKVIQKLEDIRKSGKRYAIVVVSEGVELDEFKYKDQKLSDVISRKNYGGISKFIAEKLKNAGFDAKAIILGHIQRGGNTSVEDRILGQKFGTQAVSLIQNHQTGYLLGVTDNKVSKTKLDTIERTTRNLKPDDEEIKLAKDLGIYIGEDWIVRP